MLVDQVLSGLDQPGQVILHGRYRNLQAIGDLRIGVAGADAQEDFERPGLQSGQVIAAARGEQGGRPSTSAHSVLVVSGDAPE